MLRGKVLFITEPRTRWVNGVVCPFAYHVGELLEVLKYDRM